MTVNDKIQTPISYEGLSAKYGDIAIMNNDGAVIAMTESFHIANSIMGAINSHDVLVETSSNTLRTIGDVIRELESKSLKELSKIDIHKALSMCENELHSVLELAKWEKE